jgi:hypothetical protein
LAFIPLMIIYFGIRGAFKDNGNHLCSLLCSCCNCVSGG